MQTFISETGHYYYWCLVAFCLKKKWRRYYWMLKSLWWNGKQLTLIWFLVISAWWLVRIPSRYFKILVANYFCSPWVWHEPIRFGWGCCAKMQDCRNHLCHGCDSSVNDFSPFHDRGAIVNGHIVPIRSTTSQNSKEEWFTVAKWMSYISVLACHWQPVTC